jgi:hypothetical protein
MTMIRIPVRGTDLSLVFDSDKVANLELPREVITEPDGAKRFAGPSKLILEFDTLEDAPMWVNP